MPKHKVKPELERLECSSQKERGDEDVRYIKSGMNGCGDSIMRELMGMD